MSDAGQQAKAASGPHIATAGRDAAGSTAMGLCDSSIWDMIHTNKRLLRLMGRMRLLEWSRRGRIRPTRKMRRMPKGFFERKRNYFLGNREHVAIFVHVVHFRVR